MPEQMLHAGRLRILYDPEHLQVISPEWLEPAFWELRDAVLARYSGRGSALAVATEAGPAVLRRYLRGGLPGRIVHERFVFLGHDRSRSFREWRLLQRLHAAGLPVPQPLLASCERLGLSYRAALMTRQIPGARSLAQAALQLGPADWERLGQVLGRFFRAGVIHADLNAHNLLLDAAGRWHVIDFDRGRQRSRAVDPTPMLRRLQRSLDKLGIRGHPDRLRANLSA